MNARIASLGMIAALMPLAVEAPVDSAGGYAGVTRVRLGAGGGSYAFIARGCEGQVIGSVPVRFEDVAGSLEHRIGPGPLTFGVRGGRVRHRIGAPKDSAFFPEVPLDAVVDNSYVNPFFSIEGPASGVGAGLVVHEGEFMTAGEGARKQTDRPLNDMSWHVRIGPVWTNHLLVQWMEGVPLASSGGYLTALVGGPLERDPRWALRGGLGAGGPYEGAGLVLRLEHVGDGSASLDVTTRAGVSGNRLQWGAAVGVAYAVGP